MFDLTTYIWATKTAVGIAEKAGGAKAVDISTTTGQLDEEALQTLKDSKANIIVLQQKVYRLSRIEGNDYKYINSLTEGASEYVSMTELNININTGEFYTKVLTIEGQSIEELERRFNAHVNNMGLHVSEEDRENWNNKVTAETLQISTDDFGLNLKY